MGVVLIYTHVYNTQYSRVVICYTHVARGGGGGLWGGKPGRRMCRAGPQVARVVLAPWCSGGSALFDAGEEQQHLGASARLEPVLGSVDEPPQVRHDGGVVELAADFLPVLVQHVVCELRVHLPVGEDVNAQLLERVGVLLLQRLARGAEGVKDFLAPTSPRLVESEPPAVLSSVIGYTGVAL